MSLLALFNELLESKKISGPRLQIRSLKETPQRKRTRSNTKAKQKDEEKSTKRENQIIESKEHLSEEQSQMGIIQTDSGLEYHPEATSDKPQKKRKKNTKTSIAERRVEMRETQIKANKQTVCKFYKRGRCTKKDCEFLHEGPPPLCYNMLKDGVCHEENCIYHHDTKAVGCMFFHVTHNCSRGDNCKFSHDPITEEELQELKRIHEEVELEKKSTMPVEVAKAMMEEEPKEEAPTLSFEDIPTIMPPIITMENKEEKPAEVESEEDDEYY